MNEEKIMEMRGMRRQEILDYFTSLHDLERYSSVFKGEHWMVEIGAEVFTSIGKLRIPSTIVKFKGEKEFLEQVIYQFRLRFLSAGG